MVSRQHYEELLVCIILLIFEYFKFVCAYTFISSQELCTYLTSGKFFFFFPVKTKSIFYAQRNWLHENWDVGHRKMSWLLKPLFPSSSWYIYPFIDEMTVRLKKWKVSHYHPLWLLFFPFIFISWRLITLQYCSGFCHTLTWISHGFTCVPYDF